MDNLYTTALLSYTFSLAGDEEMRSRLITHLHQKSNTEGRTVKMPVWLFEGTPTDTIVVMWPKCHNCVGAL